MVEQNPQNFLPTVNTLSIHDYLTLIQHVNPETELRQASLLYARDPEIADLLNNQFHLQPDTFASYFGQSYGPLLANLPTGYTYDLFMQRRIDRSRDMIEVDFFISSNEVNERYREIYASASTYKQYLLEREFVDSIHPTVAQEGLGNAGGFSSFLYVDGNKNQPFPALYSEHIFLASEKDTSKLILPSPLRRSETDNPMIQITDEILRSQTGLLVKLIPHFKTFGVRYARAMNPESLALSTRHGSMSYRDLIIPKKFKQTFEESMAGQAVKQARRTVQIIIIKK